MYGIRDDPASGLLSIELSGRVPTAEAARAISQAFALAEAGQRQLVLCDLREMSSGPEEPLVLASLIHARKSPGLRVAFVGAALQLRGARQVARLAGISRQCGVFTRIVDAEGWLQSRTGRGTARIPQTALRHVAQKDGVAPPAVVKARESAA